MTELQYVWRLNVVVTILEGSKRKPFCTLTSDLEGAA